jgi:hypothetical protein
LLLLLLLSKHSLLRRVPLCHVLRQVLGRHPRHVHRLTLVGTWTIWTTWTTWNAWNAWNAWDAWDAWDADAWDLVRHPLRQLLQLRNSLLLVLRGRGELRRVALLDLDLWVG